MHKALVSSFHPRAQELPARPLWSEKALSGAGIEPATFRSEVQKLV